MRIQVKYRLAVGRPGLYRRRFGRNQNGAGRPRVSAGPCEQPQQKRSDIDPEGCSVTNSLFVINYTLVFGHFRYVLAVNVFIVYRIVVDVIWTNFVHFLINCSLIAFINLK